MSKDMDEQPKLSHKVVDLVERANRKICVTLLRCNVDKLESTYAQVRLLAKKEDKKKKKKRKKEEKKFQQVVYVNYKLGEFIYSLDVKISVNDKSLLFNPFVMFYKK